MQPPIHFTARDPPWTYLKLQLHVQPIDNQSSETITNLEIEYPKLKPISKPKMIPPWIPSQPAHISPPRSPSSSV